MSNYALNFKKFPSFTDLIECSHNMTLQQNPRNVYYYYCTHCKFFPPTDVGGLSLKSKSLQVFSGL